MFKKMLATILAIAMIATMLIIPVSANADIELPTGDHYTLTASEVEPFKAGDPVTVRLTVSDVKDDWSLMGLDLTVPFNNELLEYASATSSSDIINADYPDGEVKWELIMNTNNATNGKLLITMLDDGDAWMGTSEDGAIWVELTFTALKDAVGGEFLLYTQYAEGTENVDLETAYGDGVAVYVKSTATPEPTEAPTPDPTEAPTPSPAPTVVPFNSDAVVDIDFSSTVVDSKGVLVCGRDASTAVYADLSAYQSALKGLQLNTIHDGNIKFAGGAAVNVYNGVALEFYGVFQTATSQFLGNGFYSAEVNADGTIGFWETTVGGPAYIQSTASVADGKAHHIVFVQTADEMKLYIDGVLNVTKDYAQTATALTAGELRFYGFTSDTYLSTFRVYQGAPSDAEVAALFAAVPVYVPKDEAILPILTKPSKTVYTVGEALDLNGLVVIDNKVDANDITADVTVDDSEFNSEVAGSYKIYLTYETETTIYSNYFTVHVNEPAPVVVTGIGIVSKPSKLVYTVGEELDLAGLNILVKYSDGTVEYKSADEVTVTGFNGEVAADYLMAVEYEGKIANFTLHVKEAAPVVVTGVGIVTKPSKTVYAVGEEFDPTGLKILVKYSDGSVAYLEGADVPVAGFDSSVANSFLVKIEVEGKIAQFTIHVR